jgi:hypothetical protein
MVRIRLVPANILYHLSVYVSPSIIRLGGPKRAPSDGPPGVKTIWLGLMKLYILLTYREYLA